MSGRSWLHNPGVVRRMSDELRETGTVLLVQLDKEPLEASLRAMMREALARAGRLLGRQVMQGHVLKPADLSLWASLSLFTTVSAARIPLSALDTLPPAFWQRARAVAASAEVLAAALDLLDDIQDGASGLGQHSGAIQTVGALLQLAPLLLQSARAAEWPGVAILAAEKRLHEGILQSMQGQYLDLHYEQLDAILPEQALEMTEKKSGSLLALICQLGAMATGTLLPDEYMEAIGDWGWHLGVWAQLVDDAQDTAVDRQRRKKTLPLVIEDGGMIESQAVGPEATTAIAADVTRVYAERYLLEAEKVLQSIEQRFAPHPLLWPFIDSNS
jgi:hypothetical protein